MCERPSWLLRSTRWASSFIQRCYVRYSFQNSEPNLMIAPRASAKERVGRAFSRPKYSTRRISSTLLRIPIIVKRTQLARALKSSFRMSLLAFRSSA